MKLPYCIILQFFVILAFAQKSDTNRIVVTAAEEPILYLNCENTLHIDVSNLCKKENKLIFRSNDAKITEINRRTLKIIPKKANTCHIEIFENDTLHLLGEKTLKTVFPPPPTLIVTYPNGKWIHRSDTVYTDSNVIIKIVPDAAFAKACPNDTIYEIQQISVSIQRGLNPPQTLDNQKTIGKNANKGIIVHIPPTPFSAGAKGIIDLVQIDRVSHLGRFPIPCAYSCEIKGDNIFENMIIFYLAKKE